LYSDVTKNLITAVAKEHNVSNICCAVMEAMTNLNSGKIPAGLLLRLPEYDESNA
jgi:hypothetical protein